MFQSDLGVELYRWLKERKGWTDEEIENPGAKSRIGKIFARVKDHMVEKGTATAIVAIHDRESDDADTAGDGAPGSATRAGWFRRSRRRGRRGRRRLRCGRGELLVNSVIEDQIVALCKAVTAAPRARSRRQVQAHRKEFGKKLDPRFTSQPVRRRVDDEAGREEPGPVDPLRGLKEAAPSSEKGGGGGAASRGRDDARGRRFEATRRRARIRRQDVRARLMGGWLNKPNPIDSKYVTRLCEDTDDGSGAGRVGDGGHGIASDEGPDVLVVDFPGSPTPSRGAAETAETSKAKKQKRWPKGGRVRDHPADRAGEEGGARKRRREAPEFPVGTRRVVPGQPRRPHV